MSSASIHEESTPKLFVSKRDPSFLNNAREAFVTRHEKPTYKDLGAEFDIPLGTICREAADQGWVTMRAAYLEQQLQKGDAQSVLLQAVKIDRRVIGAFSDVAFVMLSQLIMAVQAIPEDRAVSTKVEILNSASFCLKNLSDACKNIGIVGLNKTLNAEGKEGNGQWNPQMLSELNITIQNQVNAGQSGLAAAVKATVEVPVTVVAPVVVDSPQAS